MGKRFICRSVVAITLAVLMAAPIALTGAGARQAEPPLRIGGGDPRIDPSDFRVTVFADGLFYPLGMTELPDGSLLVATSNPTGGNYYDSTGELIRFSDDDGDGVADGPGELLAGDLPGALTALERAGDLVYTVSARPEGSRIVVLRLGPTPSDRLTVVGSLDFGYAVPMRHGTYALAVRPLAGQPGRHELYFNVGSEANDDGGATVTLSGLAEGRLRDASIYRLTIDDRGSTPVFSAPELIATGLRNAAGLAVQPGSGDLYFEDNGIDTPDNPIVAFSADELNRIAAADLGGRVEDFGFPTTYVDYDTGQRVGDDGLDPVVAFLPRDGDESEGASEIVFAPRSFPTGLNAGVVVGFHGQWDDIGLANEENPLLYVDLATDEIVPVVGNDEPAIGHLDGLLATKDALYAADLTGTGSLAGTEPTGVIYRIAPAGARTARG